MGSVTASSDKLSNTGGMCKLSGSKLCKLKCNLAVIKQSNVIFKVACGNCNEFYIGKTNRRLQDEDIYYASVKVLAKDSHSYRLLINETLQIQKPICF